MFVTFIIIIIARSFGNSSRYPCLHFESCIQEFYVLDGQNNAATFATRTNTSQNQIWSKFNFSNCWYVDCRCFHNKFEKVFSSNDRYSIWEIWEYLSISKFDHCASLRKPHQHVRRKNILIYCLRIRMDHHSSVFQTNLAVFEPQTPR